MESEFTTLLDLALDQGYKHSDLINQVHEAVLIEFLKKYPDQAKNASVVINAQTGQVTILSNKKDITPPDFAPRAASIARQTILQQLKTPKPPSPETNSNKPQNRPRIISEHSDQQPNFRPRFSLKWIPKFIFWGYNSFFIFILIIFLWGLLSPDTNTYFHQQIQEIGLYKGLLYLILISTPIFSITYALKNKFNKQPAELTRLFFILEIPLIILTFIFASLTQSLPIIQLFALLTLLAPILIYAHLRHVKTDTLTKTYIATAIITILLLVSSYLTLLYSFYSPIFIGSITKMVFSDYLLNFLDQLFTNFLSLATLWEIFYFFISSGIGLIFIIILMMLIFIPYFITYLLTKMFLQARFNLIKYIGEQKAGIFISVTALILFITATGLAYQPNLNAQLEILEKFDHTASFEQQQATVQQLAPHKQELIQTIKDMSNSHQRYPYTKHSQDLLYDYQYTLDFDKITAQNIQEIFLKLAYPFVYWGPTNNYQLTQNYYYLFDNPNTASPSKPQTNVKLLNRNIQTITNYQDQLATITITEEFQNNTTRQQEIIYEFSLPNEAVITDLNLGPNLEFPGVIAPKGAARETHERELNRRRDPALLEQTGPRQYRLRVFPIPAKNDRNTLNGQNQKVQFTYVVSATPEGYPLPQYSKTQNLDPQTSNYQVILNNQTIKASLTDQYIRDPRTKGPITDPCQTTQIQTVQTPLDDISTSLIPHQIRSLLQTSYNCQANQNIKTNSLINNQRIAILYDISHKNKNQQNLNQLKSIINSHPDLLQRNTIDFYQFNQQLSQPQTLTNSNHSSILEKIIPFGKPDLTHIIANFPTHKYDLTILITSQTGGFNTNQLTLTNNSQPIYIIHTQEIPPYHQDFTAYLLQTQSYIADNLIDALDHYALTNSLKNTTDQQIISVSPYWSLSANTNSLPKITNLPQITITPPPLPSVTPVPFATNNQICGIYFRRPNSDTMFQGSFTDDPQFTNSQSSCLSWMQTNFLNRAYCGFSNAEFVTIYLGNKNQYTNPLPAQGLPPNTIVHSQECSPVPQPTPTPTPYDRPVINFNQPDPLASIFNRAYLNYELSQTTEDLSKNLAYLDSTHNFAKLANIVTPYSSLLALVNQTQRNWLEQQSQSYNRYQDENLNTAANPNMPWFRENQQNFDTRSFRSPSLGIGDAFFGMKMQTFDAPSPSAGGISSPKTGGSSLALGTAGSVTTPFQVTSIGEFATRLFILANVLLLGGGGFIYLIIYLRKRRKAK